MRKKTNLKKINNNKKPLRELREKQHNKGGGRGNLSEIKNITSQKNKLIEGIDSTMEKLF